MGKRVRGAALRAKQRAKAALDQLQEKQAEEVARLPIATKPDEQLFVLDTKGDKALKATLEPLQLASSKKKKTTGPSEKDLKKIEKLRSKHSPEKLKELAKQTRLLQQTTRRRTTSLRNKTKPDFDLWDSSSSSADNNASSAAAVAIKPGIGSALAGTAPAHVTPKPTVVVKKKQPQVAVDVAKAGQSYHPDPKAHQTLIETAVSVEVRRNDAIQEKQTPLARGMSEETRALLLGDDSSEDESEDEGSAADGPVGPVPKRTDKLTRAQRNKLKRLRQEKAILEKRKKEKQLLKQVGELPRYKKELKRQEKERLERKLEESSKKQEASLPGKDIDVKLSQEDPIQAPTVPVALQSELRSSLRAIKPKGSVVADRVMSLRDRKMAAKRTSLVDLKNNPKRRKLSVKGRRNRDGVGSNFEVLG